MAARPLPEAAAELEVSTSTLRRWLADGAPQTRAGGRGRGRAALVDPEAIAAWRRSREAGEALPDDRLVALAAEIPELVADAVTEAFRRIEGPHKRATAGALAAAAYIATTAILDRLRRDAPAVPELAALPEKLLTLRAIFGDSGNVGPSQSR